MVFRSSLATLLCGFAVVAATAAPAVMADPSLPVAAAMSHTNVAGTVYKAGGIVRTAKHVADVGLDGVGFPGQAFHASRVLCSDSGTDTAFLETSAPLPDLPVGPPPGLGSRVTAVGFRLGKPPIAVYTEVVGYWPSIITEDRKKVGPVMAVTFYDIPVGMSGGPILHEGRAVGTIALYNGTHIFAVPILYAKCSTIPEGR